MSGGCLDMADDVVTTTEFEFSSLPTSGISADVTKPFNLQLFIWIYVLPAVVLIGIVGNIVSIILLLRKAFRQTTTGVYLPLTAVADIMFLLTGALEILEVTHVFDVREYNVWTCRMYKVLHYTAGDVSIWLLVAFTFDRFIAVCFPLRKQRVCRWRRAVVASTVIVLLSLAKNFHEFWTRGPEYTTSGQFRRICGSQRQYRIFLNYVRPWIVLLLVMAIPFVLILVFNCLIVRGLLRAQRVRDRAISIPSCSTASEATGKKAAASSNLRQTSFMCLGISFAFLVCVAPSIVLLIGKPYWKHHTNEPYKHAKAVSNFLVFVNHCVNFFLYCVTGQRFRDELRAILTGQRRRDSGVPTSPVYTSETPRLSPGLMEKIDLLKPHRRSDVSGLPVKQETKRDIKSRMSLM